MLLHSRVSFLAFNGFWALSELCTPAEQIEKATVTSLGENRGRISVAFQPCQYVGEACWPWSLITPVHELEGLCEDLSNELEKLKGFKEKGFYAGT